jgi:hypothetical protein
MKFADLHVHTFFSDGTCSPEDLILQAHKAGLSAIAVVDHDSVLGIEPTIEAGKKKDIEVLPGVELSTEYQGLEIHILGYLIDYKNEDLLEKLDFLKKNRIERMYKMLDKLNGLGMKLKPETVFDIARYGTVGRMHLARTMVKEGLVNSTFEAFKKYIGDKGPGYVLNFKLSPRECIDLIKSCGGIAVLAHPYIINRDEFIPRFVEFGLQGLEVYYSEHSQSMVNFYLDLAKKFNLLVTGGSDFHGQVKPDVKMGDIKIPYELVEKLKDAKEQSDK